MFLNLNIIDPIISYMIIKFLNYNVKISHIGIADSAVLA